MNVPAGAKINLVVVRRERGDARRVPKRSMPALHPHGAARDRHLLRPKCPRARRRSSSVKRRIALPLAGVIDIDAERARLKREIAKEQVEIDKIDKKLSQRAVHLEGAAGSDRGAARAPPRGARADRAVAGSRGSAHPRGLAPSERFETAASCSKGTRHRRAGRYQPSTSGREARAHEECARMRSAGRGRSPMKKAIPQRLQRCYSRAFRWAPLCNRRPPFRISMHPVYPMRSASQAPSSARGLP